MSRQMPRILKIEFKKTFAASHAPKYATITPRMSHFVTDFALSFAPNAYML